MSNADLDGLADLNRLARAWGIEVDETAGVEPDALLSALRSLGVTVGTPAEASSAYDALRVATWDWRLDPASVSWDGIGRVTLRMPADDAHLRIECNMRLEDGDGHGWGVNLTDVPPFQYELIAGIDYVAKYLPLRRLPFGYHRMYVDLPGHHTESLVISAPERAFEGPTSSNVVVEITPLVSTQDRRLSPLELRRSTYEPLVEHIRRTAIADATLSLGELAAWFRPLLADGGASTGMRLRYEADEVLAVLVHESQLLAAPLLGIASADLPDDLRAACERRGISVVEGDAGVTVVGYPNWRRRIRPSIEELDSAILATGVIDVLRRERP